MNVCSAKDLRGRVRAHRVVSERWSPVTDFRSNLVLYQWAELTAKLLATGDSRYRLSGMYLEFQNVASPGTPADIPTFGRDRTIDYYTGLAYSPDVDYLRVPMTAIQTLSTGGGLSQNQLVCFARSGGVLGVHGKNFSTAANSVICGASLIAMVDVADRTQDLLFGSFYFAAEDQQPKLATSQVGIEWEVTLS